MFRNRMRFAAMVLSIGAPAAFGQQESAKPAQKMVTPEAFLEYRGVDDPQFSPNGMQVAFVVSDPLKGEKRNRHIWLYDAASKSTRQLTYSEKAERSPKWSPDGKKLAFLSNRGEEQQIYVLRMDGGEAAAVTKGKNGVNALAWSPDGKQIAYLAPDAKTEAEEKKEKDKDDARVVDKDDKHARLRILEVQSGETRALTQANWEVKELAWMPDGKRIVVSATDHPEKDAHTNRIFAVSVADGAMKQLLAPRGPFGNLKVSPDGKNIGFAGAREDGPDPHDLWVLPAGAAAAHNLTGASLDRLIHDYLSTKNGSILVNILEGFRSRFVVLSAEGSREDVALFATNPGPFAVNGDGVVAFAGETATEAPELWIWNRKEAPAKVSEVNKAFAEYALVKPEYYKFKSFDGLEIEAALIKPAGYDGKAKLPLIALVHGGPTGAYQDSVEAWAQLLAAHGFAVYLPNVRGSTGYGHKFVEMNRADWGGGDFKDVMWGVKDLIAKGIADGDRMGIGGWSYGGYMSEWAITQTDEFKAAVSGAGMANLISEFGTENIPTYDEWFWGVPYERPAGFLNSSPFLYLKNAKTPTLILQGEADPVDPIGQSQELYRGLKRYGVPTELVLYPREPHGFQEAKHRVDMQKRMVEWFEKYVKK